MRRPLSSWHDQLNQSFSNLRRERDSHGPDRPIFVLEHGLDLDSELPELQNAVRESVAGGGLPRDFWLPYVVYATEVGYEYDGDKYWPVFAGQTPHWAELGDRAQTYIRNVFEKFAVEFGGARPTGTFAEHFGRIAWPITHAVLPSDLQKHLSRLLYEGRGMLKPELLGDHQALGERLADRAHNTPGRFQTFAENSSLLGLVAAGLLEDEDTGLLRRSTLDRITEDLQSERDARRWLKGARTAAEAARLRGLVAVRPGGSTGEVVDRQDRFRWPVPELTVRSHAGLWDAYISLPAHDLVALSFRHLRSELETIRCRVRGVEGRRARGSLMYEIGPLRLSEFPTGGESVLELENPTEELKELLTDSCRLPDAPWLFRLREPGFGIERRTRGVWPSTEYILLTKSGASVESPLFESVRINTGGVDAYRFKVPKHFDDATKQSLGDLGLGVAPDLAVWPAGLVPAGWDGEGRAIWLEGEDPIIGIQSATATAECVVRTDEHRERFPWLPESGALFVKLTALDVGVHPISIGLLNADEDRLFEYPLEIRISAPTDSLSNAGARQGLRVATHPANPKLMEIWNEEAHVEANGPHGVKVQFDISLIGQGSRRLASERFSSELPVDEGRWRELFRSARGSEKLSSFLGQAEELLISASAKALGSTQTRAIRPFVPLRWDTGRDRDGPYARLVNHGDEIGRAHV